MIYKIAIIETLHKVVEIEAETLEEAIDKVETNYSNSEDGYVLNAEDWIETNFEEYED